MIAAETFGPGVQPATASVLVSDACAPDWATNAAVTAGGSATHRSEPSWKTPSAPPARSSWKRESGTSGRPVNVVFSPSGVSSTAPSSRSGIGSASWIVSPGSAPGPREAR